MDSIFYDLNNVMQFLGIIEETSTRQACENEMRVFVVRVLEVQGSHIPSHVALTTMQSARAMLLARLVAIAKPLGFDPSVMMPPGEINLHPSPPNLERFTGQELAHVVREYLHQWDLVGVMGLASKNGAGVKQLIEMIVALRAALVNFDSHRSS